MAAVAGFHSAHRPVPTQHQQQEVIYEDASEEDTEDAMDESRDPMEESGATHDESSDSEVEDAVAEDIRHFEATFSGISKRYRLINRIGEGTFSTVYKAEDLEYDQHRNEWDIDEKENNPGSDVQHQGVYKQRRQRLVAIKKIYVTSSPIRIFNELELLHDLRDSVNVCPLITAFRHDDQVVAVLPFFPHRDFREYYRDMDVSEMRIYFHSLLTAVAAVHEHQIIHRDIKPTNFLYSPAKRTGVLVDFGLAEREGTDYHPCYCQLSAKDRASRVSSSAFFSTRRERRDIGVVQPLQYPKEDHRHSRRANRAGTRGFRAPEVLLKCTAQTCSLDVWSCGIILLTLLSRRFPFFHSADDIDAYIELCSIWGKRRMAEVSLLHGQILDTNIPTLGESGHSWERILLWSLNRRRGELSSEEIEAVGFMDECLALDPAQRITAKEALRHPFLQKMPQSSQTGSTMDDIRSD